MADTIPGNNGSQQLLAIGSTGTSDIDTPGDSDWWRVSLQVGFAYQVAVLGALDANGTLEDPYLRILNASGQQQDFNDDTSATDVDAYLEFRPGTSGTYFIAAESAFSSLPTDVGSYTISIYRDALASRSSAATMAADGRYAEDLGYRGDESDFIAVALAAGVEYVFDLVGTAYDGDAGGFSLADPWLVLRNNLGEQLTEDDDSGVGSNARIVFTPVASGTYWLDTQAFDVQDYGTYVLVANAAPRSGTLFEGSSADGTLTHDGDTRWHAVTLLPGKSYLIEALGSGANPLADPLVELLHADGSVYDYDDDSGPGNAALLGTTPETPGSYLVAVRGSGQVGTGSYTLRLTQVPRLTIADATLVEGNSGSAELVFVIGLSEASAVNLSFTVSTDERGNATAGADFMAKTQELTFAAGQTSAEFRVSVNADVLAESLEAVYATVSAMPGSMGGVVMGDSQAVGLIVDDDTARPVSDALLPQQWYLGAGNGINVLPVWSQYRGQGVRVAVFDQGIDASNPDLQPNFSMLQSRNAATLTGSGLPQNIDDNHGTAVAGVIAAAADNGGLVGVAPRATLVSIYSDLTLDAAFPQTVASALTYARGFEVLNNSWGTGNLLLGSTNYAFYDDFVNPQWAAAAAALRALADAGRGGLGTVVVQSAGNAYDVGDDTNLHNFQNSRYITTVGATDILGRSASYSSTGASILVSAPGGDGDEPFGEILSTDRTGALGYGAGGTTAVSGTSFSSPLVAGVVALMLQANPLLGWRDVQEILMRSARLTDAAGNDWASNGARDVNGGGQHFDSLSHDLGFGLVDARAAVRLAETWGRAAQTSANAVELSVAHSVNLAIPDDGIDSGAGGALDSIRIDRDLRVERAEVTLSVTHDWVGDLYVLLTSPAGTSSFLINRPASGALSAFGSSQRDIHFTLSSVLNWGENARGDWSLGVFDLERGLTGRLDAWTLTLVGRADGTGAGDDVYTYTDEFATLAATQLTRAMLADSGGKDTLNAAAVTANVRFDLSLASASHIGEQALNIATGTQIEFAVAGDGSDVLVGNALGNVLIGGLGNDTLDGGAGIDAAAYPGPVALDADLMRGTALVGGDVDQLISIEALFGSAVNDTMSGLDGAAASAGEFFRGNAGNDSIDGRAGLDYAEYLGPRANYTLTRPNVDAAAITVADNVASDGLNEGTDSTTNIERFVFADQMVAFGQRAEELARVAFVLWSPGIVISSALFARGLSYYDVGGDFNTMCSVALIFHPEQGQAFAQKLITNMPGTSRTVDGLMALMASAGGGDAGRAAAVSAMALDAHTGQALAERGVLVNGVEADLSVAGFGTLFALLPGPG